MDPVVGSLLGIGLGGAMSQFGNQQQMGQQRDLMDLSQRNQKELNEQGAKLARENWDYTNYENQVKHMDKAGLNRGLMYGSSGGAGGTLSSGSGGSASSGSAPQNTMGMALQGAQIASQTRLNEAQAKKIESETPTSGNLGDANRGNIEADTIIKKIDKDLKDLEYGVKNASQNEAIKMIQMESNRMEEMWKGQELTNKFDRETLNNREGIVKAQLSGMLLENVLTQSRTNLTNEQVKEVKQNVENSIKQLIINRRNANTNELRMMNDETMQIIQRQLQQEGLNQQEQKMYLDALTNIIGLSPTSTTTNTKGYDEVRGDWEQTSTTKSRR
jgi:hypothetical protein